MRVKIALFVKLFTLVAILGFSNFYRTTISMCAAEKIRFISTEHPKVTFFDRRFVRYMNLTSQRYGRSSPFYYVGLHFETLVPIHRNLSIDFYFFEFLSNVYKRSFVEMHFNACDLLEKDQFFGTALRQGKLTKPCPYPPDVYNLYNMSINVKAIPKHFPFKKGRIYCNASSLTTKEIIAGGHIDMEVKEFTVKNNKDKD